MHKRRFPKKPVGNVNKGANKVLPTAQDTDSDDSDDPIDKPSPVTEPAATAETVVPLQPRPPPAGKRQASEGWNSKINAHQPSQVLVASIAVGAIATACLGVWFALRPKGGKRRGALWDRCKLQPSDAVQQASPPAPLHAFSFITTEVFHIEQLASDHPTQQHGAESNTGFSSAHAIQQAIHAGATCIGRTNTNEVHLRLHDPADTRQNPTDKKAIVGLTASTAAVLVARRQADFALATDHLSGVRTAAACCGLYGYRPTRGAISKQGVRLIAGDLDDVGWICRDPSMLPRLGQAFSLPGGQMPKTELAKLIMAQDLFRLWGDRLGHAYTALLQGAQKWAGDEVAPVSLLVYLQDSVPAARSLMNPDKHTESEFVAAFGKAASLIQHSEFNRCRSEEPSSANGLQEDAGPDIDADALAAAKQVQSELQKAMHAALSSNHGYLFLPTLPGSPISRKATADDIEKFEQHAYELSSIATLSGVPQVAIPVNIPGQPLTSISVLSVQKHDARLLQLAAILGPLIAKAAQQIGKDLVQDKMNTDSEEEATTSGRGKKTKPEEAERYKAQANEAFKVGDFDGAIVGYSGAIQADPTNPVYFSNRAMAYLKVMRFAEAKEDCDMALHLELNAKTLLRRGTALLGLQEVELARADFKHVLSLEPNNRQARLELKALKEAFFEPQEVDMQNGSYEGML